MAANRRVLRHNDGRASCLQNHRRALFFFFQAEDGIRDDLVTGVQTCALPILRRRPRLRRLLLLIDVSGSMKARTEDNMRLAHVLVQAIPQAEVFTLGTRLKRREQALLAASHLVSDWDGGTRIGEALQAFLAVPRFSTYARGASVLVISDGLERGDHQALRDAVWKLSLRAWRLSWLTPLATGPGFKPQTAALQAIAPFVDDIVPGGSDEAIVAHLLSLAPRRAA